MLGLCVQRGNCTQHTGARTEVGRQRRCLVRGVARSEVGVDVAAAEAVDRLLGIADHEQRRRDAGRAEHAFEDAPLARVGVLELVHQRDRVLRAQPVDQGLGVRAVQRIGDAVDQIVIGLHALLPLEAGEAGSSVVAQCMQQLDAAGVLPFGHGGERVQVRRHGIADRRVRRGTLGGLVRLVDKRFASEVAKLRVLERRVGITRLAPGMQRVEQRGDPVGLVAATVQHLALDGRQQRGAEVVAVRAERIRQRGAGRAQARRGGAGSRCIRPG